MRDDRGRNYTDTEAVQRAKAFEAGMETLENQHNRRLSATTRREYFIEFEGCSAEVTKEAMRTLIHDEKFFPVPATIKTHISSARARSGEFELAKPVVEPARKIVYTPEEEADIKRMREDLRKGFAAMPWAKELPSGTFLNLGRSR